jgi:aminoglycoside phosphotransferase (APT) family kinase protein
VGTVTDVTAVVVSGDETPLPGGRWTAGVVKVGDTVRRPSSPASAYVADLLGHVHDAGFHGCPRYLGRDDLGRDVFSYIEGDVVARWRRFEDAEVHAAARLLRQWHDATRGFRGSGVVCHHDPGPNNAVFAAGRPVAWIDFDFAARADPIEDVAYLAWSLYISGRRDRGPAAEQARQVRLLTDAYGLDHHGRRGLVRAIDALLERNVVVWHAVAPSPPRTVADDPDVRRRAGEVVAWTRSEQRFVAEHAAAFTGALDAAPIASWVRPRSADHDPSTASRSPA